MLIVLKTVLYFCCWNGALPSFGSSKFFFISPWKFKARPESKNTACSSTAPSAQLFTRAEPDRQIEPIWLATAGCCRRLIFQTLAVVPALLRAAAAFRLAKSAKPERGRTQQAKAKKNRRAGRDIREKTDGFRERWAEWGWKSHHFLLPPARETNYAHSQSRALGRL